MRKNNNKNTGVNTVYFDANKKGKLLDLTGQKVNTDMTCHMATLLWQWLHGGKIEHNAEDVEVAMP